MPRKKKDKNQNALKHGAYSRKDMSPGEKIRDYESLREALHDEWAPEGVTEQCLVDDLCKLRWKKRRMDQYDQIRLGQRHAQFCRRNYVNSRDAVGNEKRTFSRHCASLLWQNEPKHGEDDIIRIEDDYRRS
jgi:hypothetical protein